MSLELGELELALPEIGLDLSITGFEPGEIDAVFDTLAENAADPADEALEPLEGPAVSWTGALFELGRHRLLVGDARDEAAYAQLMDGEVAEMGIHDPPYNVKIQGNVGGRGRIKRREFVCASGEMTSAQFEAFLTDTLGFAPSTRSTAPSITSSWIGAMWPRSSAPAPPSIRSSRNRRLGQDQCRPGQLLSQRSTS